MKQYSIATDIAELATRVYRTKRDAVTDLRRVNGRLHGKFIVHQDADDIEDGWTPVEGWNLGPNEGCNTAVIQVRNK